ncbi:MAG: hypothetical protein GY940_02185 [bacterium]|nr:hypothetical protein [bacterium]
MKKHVRLNGILTVTILALLLSVFPVLTGGPVFAGTSGSPDLFLDTQERGSLDRSSDPTVIRSRFITVNFDLLPTASEVRAGNRGQANFLDLNFFGGTFHTAVLDRIDVNNHGYTTWTGHLEDVRHSQVILVYKDDIMSGNIALPGAFYQVRFAGNNLHAVHEVDHSKFDDCGVTGTDSPSGASHTVDGVFSSLPVDGPSDSGSSIDVLVVYNAAARAGAGGTSAMNSTINLAISETNTGYGNSGVNPDVNLVHAAEVSYTESGSIFTDKSRLQGTSDGYMDTVHSLRDTYGADVVVLITEGGGGYCGVASLMWSVSNSFKTSAFCVVKRSCATGYYSFAHEIGHLMGARHDRYVDNTDNSPYAYNHGFVNVADNWRTIMGYNTECSDNATSCTRLNYWSNPNKTYGGDPMGVADGDPAAADNRKTLNNTAYTVANFRTHIAAASVKVSSPNGGESLTVGAAHTVKWTSTGTVGNVKIEYSTNNGGSWSTVVSSTSNDGSYSWTVPNAVSSQCLVRIKEASDGSPSDTSNQVFSIVAAPISDTVTVTSPNGGETLTVGDSHTITWSSSGTVGNVKIEYSVNNGSSWSTVTSSTSNDGSYSWTVPNAVSTQCLVRVGEASGGSPTDTSNSVFSIAAAAIPPEVFLGRTRLDFGGNTGGTVTGSQTVLVENDGGGTLSWSTGTADSSWLSVSPASGNGSGVLTVSVDCSGMAEGPYSGSISVSDSNASNSPQSITVNLNVYNNNSTAIPFGEFSTPATGSSVSSSVPVTGWVCDDIDVAGIKIYNGSEYIGDAVFVEGARPDVVQAYPGYPKNYQAGWGYMLLTNFLPGGGTGTYTLYAKATDAEGNQVTLGSKTITVDNANAVKPFGAIDTPGQGGTASGGSFVNWGWVLTPQPNNIPTDGSTIDVWVDGVKLGHPVYNIYRSDIANFFPGYANSNGATGYFYLDTTGYANGIHTIQWTAKDSGGNSEGIGSRFFNIQNSGSDSNGTAAGTGKTSTADSLSVDFLTPVRFKTGHDEKDRPKLVYPGENGVIAVEIKELDRLEIHFPGPVSAISRLPIGSSIDVGGGVFTWNPGAGFTGNYEFVFARWNPNGDARKVKLTVKIRPKFSN